MPVACNKASRKADGVMVYAHGHAAEVWWKGLVNKVTRLDSLQVWRLPTEAVAQLSRMAERSMHLQVTLQEGEVTFSNANDAVHFVPQRWK